jgi:NAD(P)-dependent dehydrogenase (short-subunit alcohol dehydrogenase family)
MAEKKNKKIMPAQKQQLPGKEKSMHPKPITDDINYKASGKLQGKVAFITGGDSGIGKAVAILFAKEGAKISIVYLNEHRDAKNTQNIINGYGSEAILIPGDIANPAFCKKAIDKTIKTFGKIDILVNNAGEQHAAKDLETLLPKNLERTFRVNILAMFYITKAAIPYMDKGSSIINTASVTAYKGSPELLDYSSTKGAIVAFTRSLSMNLEKKEIRVNAVAPGPIWTPLIPASYSASKTSKHGANTPKERPGQPVEVAYSYLFLATEGSTYMSGQVLHPNGGTVING